MVHCDLPPLLLPLLLIIGPSNTQGVPGCNSLLSKARYLKFLPFLTSLPSHLHIKECRAWNLLGKEPQAWSSWGKEPLGWSSLENAHQEWSSLGRGRLGWSSWEKDQWIASPSIAATLFYQRCWG